MYGKHRNLKKIIIESRDYVQSLSFKDRSFEFEKNANYVFVGMRRAGKTFLIYNLIKERAREDFYILILRTRG